ncbi:MAG TPA: PHB depolymerase family esterase, partial [Gemmatimonadaceae bacterium]
MKIRTIARAALAVVVLPILLGLIVVAGIRLLDRTNGSIVSSGRTRRYLVHVPPSYDRAKPTPLVISLHGAAGWPRQQQYLSQWSRLADAQGFIVVYPAGTGFPQIWHVFRDAGLPRDVKFISGMIDTLERTYDIDSTRIYVDGISNGGGMAFVLSCTLSDRIAAIGLVAAAQTLPWSWCADHRPMPMIAFHGTADPIIPYTGGHSPVAPEIFPDVESWVSQWAQRNRCASRPHGSSVAADVTRHLYTGCADSASVVLYTIRGGGHTWPGG